MMTNAPPQATDAPGAMSRQDWLATLARMGDELGRFEPLGADHWALFNEDAAKLLVSFENLETICAGAAGEMPVYHNLATQNGWSHLSIIAGRDTWYRDADLYAYFDRLVDDGFFDDYDTVLFYGAGSAGYAACAYSVAAPGAIVLAVQPRATLDPAFAGWDRRDLAARRLNFTDRYGFAPDMIEGAERVFVLCDPTQAEDAMHAALLQRPHVTRMACPYLNDQIAPVLSHMKVLPKLMKAAMDKTLTPQGFARLWRARRNNGAYLRKILAKCAASGHPLREAMVCRSVTGRMRAPSFARRLAEIEQTLTQNADKANF